MLKVYLDTKVGSDTSHCGSLTTPCKTLSKGVQQVAGYGKVYVSGTHYIRSPIKITKNLEIIGRNGASLIRKRGVRLDHVFEAAVSLRYAFSKTGPSITFSSLVVQAVGLVDVTESATIGISRCIFRGPTRPVDLSKINLGRRTFTHRMAPCIQKRGRKSNSNSRLTLNIEASNFWKTLPIIIEQCPKRKPCFIRFSVKDSVFNQTDKWRIEGSQKGKIKEAIFDMDKGFDLVEISKLEILKCKLLNTDTTGSTRLTGMENYYGETKKYLKPFLILSNVLMKFVRCKDAQYPFLVRQFSRILIQNSAILNSSTDVSPLTIYKGDVRITNLSCISNVIKENGGCVLLNRASKVSISYSEFINNETPRKGGAIYVPMILGAKQYNSYVRQSAIGKYKIISSIFCGNSAYEGGSLHVAVEKLSIINCTFSGNFAANDGGSIFVYTAYQGLVKSVGTASKIKDSFFHENRGKNGGSLYIHAPAKNVCGNHTIDNCSFYESEAESDGGALGLGGVGSIEQSIALIDSTISRCTAGNRGGAAAIKEVKYVQMHNCLLVENSASVSSGGAHITTRGDDSRVEVNRTSFINCSSPSLYISGKEAIVQNAFIKGK